MKTNAPIALQTNAELTRIMQAHSQRVDQSTVERIEVLMSACIEGMDHDSEKLLTVLFLKAFKRLIGEQALNENLYLQKYEIPQIRLFDILIKKFPFVGKSQEIINHAICENLTKVEEAAIIDIGIGLGTQMRNVTEMCKDYKHLKKLTIVGIEPAEEALRSAEKNILECRAKTGFQLEFVGVKAFAEHVDFKQFTHLSPHIIVNASLALHHICQSETRSAVIANIKQMNPMAFLLIEPNSDHFEPDFFKRFQNCYNHFYNIFKVIDKIDIETVDKNALKLFFGREIEDIIGKQNKDRFELHEPAARWIGRLRQQGFTLKQSFVKLPSDIGLGIKVNFHAEGFLGFTTDEETILAAMYAQ